MSTMMSADRLLAFATVLPQLVDRAQGRIVVQLLLLGLAPNAFTPASDSLW
ncbi:hypothetical protein ACIBKZ_16820 [Streptomyces sp. NPDC050421]|uniref:hypothetical protein n=1 Tax=Streptomyces sp. NPDC050421 TaxID=3365613 RepID=UPI00379744B2